MKVQSEGSFVHSRFCYFLFSRFSRAPILLFFWCHARLRRPSQVTGVLVVYACVFVCVTRVGTCWLARSRRSERRTGRCQQMLSGQHPALSPPCACVSLWVCLCVCVRVCVCVCVFVSANEERQHGNMAYTLLSTRHLFIWDFPLFSFFWGLFVGKGRSIPERWNIQVNTISPYDSRRIRCPSYGVLMRGQGQGSSSIRLSQTQLNRQIWI